MSIGHTPFDPAKPLFIFPGLRLDRAWIAPRIFATLAPKDHPTTIVGGSCIPQRDRAASIEPPTREEFELLSRLHKAQDEPPFRGQLVSSLVTEAWERTYPEHENVPSKIFGGYLVRRAFELASINAEEIAPDRPLVVAVNRINFMQPVRMGDKLHFVSRVVYTGGTSLCVEVSIELVRRPGCQRQRSDEVDERQLVERERVGTLASLTVD